MGMPQSARGPTAKPEVSRSTWKRFFPAFITPGLYLIGWTRYNVDLSYFAAAHTFYSSCFRLQLTSWAWSPKTVKCFKVCSSTLRWFFISIDVFQPWKNLSFFKTKWQSSREHVLPQDSNSSEGTYWSASGWSIIGQILHAQIKLKSTINMLNSRR